MDLPKDLTTERTEITGKTSQKTSVDSVISVVWDFQPILLATPCHFAHTLHDILQKYANATDNEGGRTMNELSCHGDLHPKAIEGMKLFNEGKFFDAHEKLETAWRDEIGEIRNLYRGILQIAVTYLLIMRGNYEGAIKVHGRSLKWLTDWPDVCRGIQIKKFRDDAQAVVHELEMLGRKNIGRFNKSLFKQIVWDEKRKWICDRCGSEMHEKNCKISCPNCGNRFDCSDLNIYVD